MWTISSHSTKILIHPLFCPPLMQEQSNPLQLLYDTCERHLNECAERNYNGQQRRNVDQPKISNLRHNSSSRMVGQDYNQSGTGNKSHPWICATMLGQEPKRLQKHKWHLICLSIRVKPNNRGIWFAKHMRMHPILMLLTRIISFT